MPLAFKMMLPKARSAARSKNTTGRPDSSDIKSILAIRLDKIGDHILTTPAYALIKAWAPHAELVVAVRSAVASIPRNCPFVDEVITYDEGAAIGGLKRLGKRLRSYRFDIAIALKPRFKLDQALVAYVSGAPTRIGVMDATLGGYGFAFTHPLPPYSGIGHEVVRTLGIAARGLGIEPPARSPLVLDLPETALEFAGRSLPSSSHPLLCYHISAYDDGRLWPLENFRELINRLKPVLRAQSVITAVPKDEENARQLAAETGSTFIPTPEILDLSALISRADLFITTHGGPMHLASAVNTPQVVLFGPPIFDQWHPWQGEYICLGERGMPAESVTVDEMFSAVVRGGLLSSGGSGGECEDE